MKRGEVWLANLSSHLKDRPVLILSRDSMPAARGEITLAYITSHIRNTPWEVVLVPGEGGVNKLSAVNLDSINTIPKSYLYKRIGRLSQQKMSDVAQALRFALDLF